MQALGARTVRTTAQRVHRRRQRLRFVEKPAPPARRIIDHRHQHARWPARAEPCMRAPIHLHHLAEPRLAVPPLTRATATARSLQQPLGQQPTPHRVVARPDPFDLLQLLGEERRPPPAVTLPIQLHRSRTIRPIQTPPRRTPTRSMQQTAMTLRKKTHVHPMHLSLPNLGRAMSPVGSRGRNWTSRPCGKSARPRSERRRNRS
jgi:hypothetical protein